MGHRDVGKTSANSPCPGAGDVAWLQPPLYELLASATERKKSHALIRFRHVVVGWCLGVCLNHPRFRIKYVGAEVVK